MQQDDAIGALGALAHASRLEVFRLLVRAGPSGMAAGEIARALGSLPNTLSTNLGILSAAGLVSSRRDGRSIVYAARYESMRDLLAFLMEDCCAGNPEICAPLTQTPQPACAGEGGAC
ncbi:MAG: metalloregulator ArsR/SmtB family transcription factor [Pseudomonadota bacterium]